MPWHLCKHGLEITKCVSETTETKYIANVVIISYSAIGSTSGKVTVMVVEMT